MFDPAEAPDRMQRTQAFLGGMTMFRPSLFVAMAIGLLLPAQALPQQTSPAAPTSSPPAEPSGISQLLPGAALDTQFKALLQARDQEVAVNAELRRLLILDDNFRSQMQSALDDFVNDIPPDLRSDRDIVNIEAAQSDLDNFEKKLTPLSDVNTLQKAAEDYDSNYPLFELSVLSGDSAESWRLRRQQTFEALSRFRVACFKAVGGFSGISSENQGWQRRYEQVCKNAVSSLTAQVGRQRFPSLAGLPSPHFYMLAAKSSWASLKKDDINTAIRKYRAALDSALANAQERGSSDPLAKAKTVITDEARSIRPELDKSAESKAGELANLESSITNSVRTLYGDKVGSASFIYLLVVFVMVFGVIMIAPKIYGNTIAANILKAEFLLQFSTVFVLVAAIIILGIGGLIDKQQLPVLLAGISGYVLGQLGKVGTDQTALRDQTVARPAPPATGPP